MHAAVVSEIFSKTNKRYIQEITRLTSHDYKQYMEINKHEYSLQPENSD